MRKPFSKIRAATDTANGRFWAITLFIGLVFLTGGGARADISSLLLLRPAAVFFAAYALSRLTPQELAAVRAPLVLLALLALVIAVQLVPLPPELWTQLPDRAQFAQIARTAQLEEVWRPLSLSPARSWNSLISLVVPLAALLLFAMQPERNHRKVLALFLGVAVLSAVVAMLQLSGSPAGPLYFYRVTNNGFAVGLFANRNHHAVFLAMAIVIAGWYFSALKSDDRMKSFKAVAAAGSLLMFIPLLFLAGSRAGLALGGVAVLCAAAFFFSAPLLAAMSFKAGKRRFSGRWLVGIFLGLVVLLAAAAILLARDLSVSRLTAADATQDMRYEIADVLLRMAQDYWQLGTGFGSFEFVYKIHEPFALLIPTYLNQAHNDWAQLVIEGGIPAIALLLLFFGWLAASARKIWHSQPATMRNRRIASYIILAMMAAASVVDYPLRTPSIMLFAAICCALIAWPVSAVHRSDALNRADRSDE